MSDKTEMGQAARAGLFGKQPCNTTVSRISEKSVKNDATADNVMQTSSQFSSTDSIVRASARAAAALFASIVRRNGRTLTATDELSLGVLLEALERARDEGSVCLGLRRYRALAEAVKKDAAAGAETLPETLEELVSALVQVNLAAVYAPEIGKMPAAPIIVDRTSDETHVYAERNFHDEQRLARRILSLAFPDGRKPEPEEERLAEDPAKRAVALAGLRRLVVVSGGPGTGKTTIVTSVLAKLLAGSPDARIALAAPTGKAAGRMQQAVHDTARKMTGNSAVVERLESLTASTIHRLLMTPQDDGSRPGPDSPLDADVLVVDESSMIDMGLAIRLFDAIDLARTRVVLLGDRHQLAAVGPGSVFADLSETAGRLRHHIAELTVSHRFAADKAIGELSALVNAGSDEAVFEKLLMLDAASKRGGDGLGGDDNVVRWHRSQTIVSEGLTQQASAWLSRMMARIIAAVEAQRAMLEKPALPEQRLAAAQAVARAMRSFGVLAAQRRGPMSVEAVNRAADARLVEAGLTGRRWRQIIVRSNDPVLELYNGDVGVVVPGTASSIGETPSDEVFFLDSGRFVKVGLLPNSDEAFAITIHQSQGSEYHHVAVLMPVEADSPLATRELFYTAMTRVSDVRSAEGVTAYGSLDVFASAEVIRRAVRTPVVREGGLALRLEQIVSVDART